MINQLFKDKSLASDFLSGAIALAIPGIKGISPSRNVLSISISWNNAAGTLTGELTILGSSDGKSYAPGFSCQIASASNSADPLIIVPASYCKYLKIQYKSNGITGGTISAGICYKE